MGQIIVLATTTLALSIYTVFAIISGLKDGNEGVPFFYSYVLVANITSYSMLTIFLIMATVNIFLYT